MTGQPEQLTGLALLLVLAAICFSALLAVCYALFPRLVGRTRTTIEKMPVRSFLIGLINFLFFGIIAAALFSTGRWPALFGLLVAGCLFSIVALGISAVALLVGERLLSNRGSASGQVAAGGAAMLLASAVPFVGWFVLPAVVAFTGLGAAIIALLGRGRTE